MVSKILCYYLFVLIIIHQFLSANKNKLVQMLVIDALNSNVTYDETFNTKADLLNLMHKN